MAVRPRDEAAGQSMRRDSWWLGVLAAVGAVSGGCASPPKSEVGRDRLVATASPYFADLPVPSGFKMLDGETTDYMTRGLRYARQVYQGSADPVRVREFFQEQMPLSRWTWVDTENEGGVQSLRFRKDEERCDVTVTREGRGLFLKTMIRIRISPMGTVVPARTKSGE